MPFAPHTVQSAPERSRTAMTSTKEKFGTVPEAVARLATAPQLLNTFLSGSAAVEATTLSPLAREVAIMTIATRHDCRVCVGIHTAALRRLGAPAVAESLRAGEPLEDPYLEAMRSFVGALFAAYGDVSTDTLQAFLAAGYTKEQALEVVLVIGIYTMSTFANRLVGA